MLKKRIVIWVWKHAYRRAWGYYQRLAAAWCYHQRRTFPRGIITSGEHFKGSAAQLFVKTNCL